jgi:hypothetical protein
LTKVDLPAFGRPTMATRIGLAEAQLEGLVKAVCTGATLALVGDGYGGYAGGEDLTGEHRVGGDHTLAGVEYEQHEIGPGQRQFTVLAHARSYGPGRRFLQTRGVDHRHRIAGNQRLTAAAIPG